MEKQEIKKYENEYIQSRLIIAILLINILPVILMNLGKRESVAVPSIVTIAIYVFQIMLMFIYLCAKKIALSNITKKYMVIWSVFTLILLAIQLYNYVFSKFNIQDIMNIITKYITVTMFIIFTLSLKMEKKEINKIYKFLFFLGIISCLYNVVFYINDIVGIARIQSSYSVNIKSFFANRNQLSQFLVISAISTYFIIKENKKNLIYKIGLVIIIGNIFLTMSRTAILAIGIFIILNFLYNKSLRDKILIILFVILIGAIGIICLNKLNPSILENVNRLIIRADNLENASGRMEIWKEAINVVDSNIAFGVGRFNGIDMLNDNGFEFTQFHNVFIESYVSGGIIEVILLLYLIIFIFYNLIKNKNIENKRRIIYIASFISFIIMGLFESCNRFSIGYVDIMFTIFYFTMPLLELNTTKKEDEMCN